MDILEYSIIVVMVIIITTIIVYIFDSKTINDQQTILDNQNEIIKGLIKNANKMSNLNSRLILLIKKENRIKIDEF